MYACGSHFSSIGEDAKKTNDPLALLFGLNKTTIDYTKAFALCHAGVSAGSTPNSNLARSLSLLAQCYYWGMGVAEDREKSIAVWRMHGCDALPPSLMSMVFGDSASWVKMSEDKKKAAVAQAAADCKFGPDESDPDPYSAVSMCVLTPPKKNKRDVQLHIASTITNTLYPYAIKRLRQAADQGDAHAQFFVGMCYSGNFTRHACAHDVTQAVTVSSAMTTRACRGSNGLPTRYVTHAYTRTHLACRDTLALRPSMASWGINWTN